MMKYFSNIWNERGLVSFALVVIVGGIFFSNSCVTPFEPKIDRYDNLLVVEGLLTNEQGTSRVRLSHTYPYNRRNPLPETGAIVTIADNLGNEYRLTGDDKGYYYPEDTLFYGNIGLFYKVMIETSSGELYESEFEELKEPIPIENITYEGVNKGQGLYGIQLYLDTYDPANNSHYYAWDFVETWQIEVPYVSSSVYLPEMKICYTWNTTNAIIIKSTRDYSEDRLIKYPFYFIDNTTNRLKIKYSLQLRQYVLNEKSYLFYKHLKSINENAGTLFDKIPVRLTGNVRNVKNPEKPVLGNFQVSGVSTRRFYVLNDELPANIRFSIPTGFEFCTTVVLHPKRDNLLLDSLSGQGWAVMDTLIEETELDTFYGLAASRACFDCKLSGEIEMPSFWPDY